MKLQLKNLKFVVGDLFSSLDQAYAHCVSRDLHMGAGVATIFKKKYGQLHLLKQQKGTVGSLVYLHFNDDKNPQYVFYLITKDRYFQKPTFDNFRSSIGALAEYCREFGVKTLSIPKIGCGLDKLKFFDVVRCIDEIFGYVQTEVTMYLLPGDGDISMVI